MHVSFATAKGWKPATLSAIVCNLILSACAAVTIRQKYNAIVLWARLLGYFALAFFALAFAAVLGWPRIIPGQLMAGAIGFPIFFCLSLWVLRFLPLTTDGAEP